LARVAVALVHVHVTNSIKHLKGAMCYLAFWLILDNVVIVTPPIGVASDARALEHVRRELWMRFAHIRQRVGAGRAVLTRTAVALVDIDVTVASEIGQC
tara:strand:+ start:454 stop:750 length:297 start_codon:yes stop_codon:yes gene_type:complete